MFQVFQVLLGVQHCGTEQGQGSAALGLVPELPSAEGEALPAGCRPLTAWLCYFSPNNIVLNSLN